MSQGRLLGVKRFAPFFWTQFLGAFNDNVLKQAMVVLFTLTATDAERDGLSNLAAALFILPFFLFSATAGQLAEKFDKARLIQWIKGAEVAIMILASAGFFLDDRTVLFVSLFLMGTHSAFFGPVKLAILPQTLTESELVGGNGLVEMGTYVAILIGQIVGALLAVGPLTQYGISMPLGLSLVLTAASAVGLLTAMAIPSVAASEPTLRVSLNIFKETARAFGFAKENRTVYLSILGNAWFWFLGVLYLAQLPGFTENVLNGGPSVITLLLVMFSIGVGIGSLLCEKLSGGHIELGLVPFGSIGMTLFGVGLHLSSAWYIAPSEVRGPLALLSDSSAWPILFCLGGIGVFGGFYSVPLYALIQHRSDPSKRSRIIGGLNIVSAVFMVAATIFASLILHPELVGLPAVGLTIPQLFLLVAILNAVVAFYIYSLLPEFLLRFAIWMLMRTMYRLTPKNVDRVPADGPVLLAVNHVSFVDAFIVAAAIHRPVRFVMWYRIYELPIIHWFFKAARVIPIASRKERPELTAQAFELVNEALKNGEAVCIFPEGGITYSGEIEPFRRGVEDMTERYSRETGKALVVLPMALKGLWGSFFSRRGGPAMRKRPRRFRSQIELEVGDVSSVPVDGVTLSKGLEQAVRQLRGERR